LGSEPNRKEEKMEEEKTLAPLNFLLSEADSYQFNE
jgi:hypothetical protein